MRLYFFFPEISPDTLIPFHLGLCKAVCAASVAPKDTVTSELFSVVAK